MKRYTYTYRKTTKRDFTGTYKELVTELEKTGEQLMHQNGKKYIIGYPSSGYISEIDPDNFGNPCRKIDVKPYVHNVIRKQRVTEADYKRLTDALNNGKLKFDDLFKMYGFV